MYLLEPPRALTKAQVWWRKILIAPKDMRGFLLMQVLKSSPGRIQIFHNEKIPMQKYLSPSHEAIPTIR